MNLAVAFYIRRFVAASIFLCGCVAANDWPRFLGPNGDGSAPDCEKLPFEQLFSGLRTCWTIPLLDEKAVPQGRAYAQNNTYSGPAVANGYVYAICRHGDNDMIQCVEAESGKKVWETACPAQPGKKEYGTGVRAFPLVYNSSVYVMNYFNDLYCLDTKSGAIKWVKHLKKEYDGKVPSFGSTASPVVLDGMLICEPGGPSAGLVALEPETGREIWKSGSEEPAYATPKLVTLDGQPQILAYVAAGLISVEPKTGKELWRFPFFEDWRKNIAAPVALGNLVVISNNTLGTVALNIQQVGGKWDVTKKWTNRTERMNCSSPIFDDKQIIFHDGKGSLKCLDLDTGKLKWSVSNMGSVFGALIKLSSTVFLCASDDGHVALLEMSQKACTKVARFQMVGVSFPQPAIANGKLYLQDFKNLVCIDLANTSLAVSAKPLPPPPGMTWAEYWQKASIDLTMCLIAALVLAISGTVLVEQRRFDAVIAICAAAALASGLAMFLQGLYPDSVFKQSTKPLLMSMVFGGMAALLCVAPVPKGRRFELKSLIAGIITIIGVTGCALLARSQLATVDILSLVTSTAIHGRLTALGYLWVMLGLSVFAAILARPFGGLQALNWRNWRAWLMALLIGTSIGCTVQVCGVTLGVLMTIFVPLAASNLRSLGPLGYCLTSAVMACLAYSGGWGLNIFAGQPHPLSTALVAVAVWPVVWVFGKLFPAKWPFRQRIEITDPRYVFLRKNAKWLVPACLVPCGFIACWQLVGFDNSLPPSNQAATFIPNSANQWPVFRGPHYDGIAAPATKWPLNWKREVDAAGTEKVSGILWKSPVARKGHSSPVIWDKQLYMTGSDNGINEVFAYDINNGHLLWRHQVGATFTEDSTILSGHAASTLATDGKRVYALFASGEVAALSPDGKEIWSVNLGAPLHNMYGFASSVTLWHDSLILQLDIEADKLLKPCVLALQCETGKKVWQTERNEGSSWSTPIIANIAGGEQIITCSAPRVIAYKPETGEEIWRAAVLDGDVVPSAVMARGMVLVCNDHSCLAAIRPNGQGDVSSTHVAWKASPDELPDTSTPVSDGEYIYLASASGKITAHRVRDGQSVWNLQCERGFNASPLLLGKELYLFDNAGVGFRISTGENGKLLATCPLGDKVLATPAPLGGRIYIRGEKNLYCVGE